MVLLCHLTEGVTICHWNMSMHCPHMPERRAKFRACIKCTKKNSNTSEKRRRCFCLPFPPFTHISVKAFWLQLTTYLHTNAYSNSCHHCFFSDCSAVRLFDSSFYVQGKMCFRGKSMSTMSFSIHKTLHSWIRRLLSVKSWTENAGAHTEHRQQNNQRKTPSYRAGRLQLRGEKSWFVFLTTSPSGHASWGFLGVLSKKVTFFNLCPRSWAFRNYSRWYFSLQFFHFWTHIKHIKQQKTLHI